mmetsp:Transcript_12765/g.25494  ORF Transcript_12765/g.25494 Transcript_12765/m.25494 type:complete len:200 (+) Transcript_12765:1681-2280(+)
MLTSTAHNGPTSSSTTRSSPRRMWLQRLSTTLGKNSNSSKTDKPSDWGNPSFSTRVLSPVLNRPSLWPLIYNLLHHPICLQKSTPPLVKLLLMMSSAPKPLSASKRAPSHGRITPPSVTPPPQQVLVPQNHIAPDVPIQVELLSSDKVLGRQISLLRCPPRQATYPPPSPRSSFRCSAPTPGTPAGEPPRAAGRLVAML